MRLARAVLALTALVFFVLAVALLARPQLAALVDLPPTTPTARVELAAMYSGLELGVAAFLALCAVRGGAWLGAGLLMGGFALGGLGTVRLGVALAVGPVAPLMYGFALAEILGAVLCFRARARVPRAPPQQARAMEPALARAGARRLDSRSPPAGERPDGEPATASDGTMSYDVSALLELLDLEPLEHNIYRGQSRDIGSGRVYGGQVLAQALVAARRTVDEERTAHSLHGYFILPGDIHAPIVYFVDRLRDGKSFTTRQVTAIQHGRAIFNMSVSFQVAEDDGPDHQAEMPEVPPPEELPRELDLVRAMADRIPEPLRAVYTQDRPIDFRPVSPVDPFQPERRAPAKHVWFRAVGEVPEGDVLAHQATLAYASDYGLLGTALLPHGLSFQMRKLQAATLDHALWFHRPFRASEWLLYSMDAPSASGARGFTRGSIFTRDGRLVASSAQEGLLRVREG